MIKNQIGKRNLNDYQKSVMALKLEELLKPMAKANQGTRTDILTTLSKSYTPITPINTRSEVAKVANVAEGTIAKVKVIESKATPAQKAKLILILCVSIVIYKIISNLNNNTP